MNLVRAGLLSVAGLVAAATTHPAAPTPPSAFPATQDITLEDLDLLIDVMKKSTWSMPANLGNPAPEPSGRSIEEDIAQYLVTDALLQQLEAERIRIAGGVAENDALAGDDLIGFHMLLLQESCRFSALSGYWLASPLSASRKAMVQSMLERLPSERAAVEAHTSALDQRLRGTREVLHTDMEDCATIAPGVEPSFYRRQFAVLQEYDALRARLAALIDDEVAGGRLPENLREREQPCPLPAEVETSGDAVARVRHIPDLDRLYPPEERRLQIEGHAAVRLEWDATGCVRRAAVTKSSGSDALDETALRAAFETQMHPAIVNGIAQPDSAVLPIRFSLRAFDDQPQP